MRDFSVLYHSAKNASSEAEHTERCCCSQKHAVVSSSGLNSGGGGKPGSGSYARYQLFPSSQEKRHF